jgi:hypothetical protein
MRLASLAALSLIFVSAPASAQVAGSRFTKNAGPADAAKAFKMWIECAARLDEKWARGVLETLPSTEAEEAMFAKRMGANDRCLVDTRLVMDGRSLQFSSESMRGELSRFYVMADFSNGQARGSGGATSWLSERLTALPAAAKYHRPSVIAHGFAACLADEHWAEARALVASVRSSAQEKVAMAALAPHLGTCIAGGVKMNLTLPILRLYLAEAVYHSLTHIPAVAQPTPNAKATE